MSGMSQRNAMPMPPAADHERHDAMLVAQLVAGDTLEAPQQAEAQRLVAGCGACAALAADLRAVSAAVAREPVPPRRRDFRLTPEQAEELSGNALTRLLGRLSLPSARAFQPAAAGVLSVGLLFVVAGHAWPDGGTITVQAEPNFAVYGTAAPALDADVVPTPGLPEAGMVDRTVSDESSASGEAASPGLIEGIADDTLGFEGLEVTEEPAPVVPEERLDDLAASEELDTADELAAGADAEFFETLPESQAGDLDRMSQKSITSEAELPEEAAHQRAADTVAAPEAPAAEPVDDAEPIEESLIESDALGATAGLDAAYEETLEEPPAETLEEPPAETLEEPPAEDFEPLSDALDEAAALEAAPLEAAAEEPAEEERAVEEPAVEQALGAVATESEAAVGDAGEGALAAENEASGVGAAEPQAETEAAGAVAPEPQATTEATEDGAAAEAVQSPIDEGGPEEWLITLGLLLAVTGGGLLVLGWLARRARDPLAP